MDKGDFISQIIDCPRQEQQIEFVDSRHGAKETVRNPLSRSVGKELPVLLMRPAKRRIVVTANDEAVCDAVPGHIHQLLRSRKIFRPAAHPILHHVGGNALSGFFHFLLLFLGKLPQLSFVFQ